MSNNKHDPAPDLGVLHLSCPDDADLFVTDRRNTGNDLERIPGGRLRLTISGQRGSGSVDVSAGALVDLMMGVAVSFDCMDAVAKKLDEWTERANADQEKTR